MTVKILRKFILNFCRKILGVKQSTNLDCLYGELGRLPMKVIRKSIILKFWVKILKSPDNHIIKLIYNMLRNDTENNLSYNGNNWAFNIREMLNQLGMTDLWLNQNTDVINLTQIKQRIHDNFTQS